MAKGRGLIWQTLWRFMSDSLPIHDMPLASKGLHSYRYRGRYGWIMIGAVDNQDALREARRSLDSSQTATLDKLETWDGSRYIPVNPLSPKP